MIRKPKEVVSRNWAKARLWCDRTGDTLNAVQKRIGNEWVVGFHVNKRGKSWWLHYERCQEWAGPIAEPTEPEESNEVS